MSICISDFKKGNTNETTTWKATKNTYEENIKLNVIINIKYVSDFLLYTLCFIL